MCISNRLPGHAGAAFRSGWGPHLGIAGWGRVRKVSQEAVSGQSLKQSGASRGGREAAELRGILEGRATRKGAQLVAEHEGEGGV